uniref:Ammonia transport outward protein 2 n=1 Tax=Anthurium amnicola TaxID=1678845 RepID=A0A1D1Y5S1_9ARAE
MSSLEEGKIADTKPAPKIANPAPLGLCGFALTTFVLSIHNAGATTVILPNIVIGLALFYGGLAQLLAGMWEFKTGNTFGATAFSSYGAFWLSFAAILLIPIPAVPDDPHSTDHAIGIFLLGWTIFTFLLFLATFRSSGGIMALFFFLTATFLFLTLGKFFQLDPISKSPNGLTKGGGVLGIITALIAWYNALAGLLTPESSYFTLPTFDLSRKNN